MEEDRDPAALRLISKDTYQLFAVDLEAAAASYSAGTGNAAIFRGMAANSRRVGWLSASGSQ